MAKNEKPEEAASEPEAPVSPALAAELDRWIAAGVDEGKKLGGKAKVYVPSVFLAPLADRLAATPGAAEFVEFFPEESLPPRSVPPTEIYIPGEPFKGGAYDVALPASAPQKLLLFGGVEVAPGGPPQTVNLPAGEGGEHQLLDLQRHFLVTPAKPKAATPDPRMTASK